MSRTSPSHSREQGESQRERELPGGGGNPERLITEHLDVWSSAIKRRGSQGRGSSKKIELYGITKLRELILELAMKGLLVPQDESDEPASVLLAKISAEKDQLVRKKEIKKQKVLAPIDEEEKPFTLSKGWSWVRLGDICVLENGDRSKNYPNKSLLVDHGIPFVNAGHLKGGRIDETQMTFITEERFDLLKAGKFTVGDILFCLRGSLGKSAVVENISKGAIASSLVIVRLMKNMNRMFIHNYFDSPMSYKQIFRYDNGTAQPNLSAADLAKFLIPLPPEAEQSRIVAKVDELMALCDQLEQQQESSISAHQTLVETLLAALTNAGEKGSFNEAWARIAEHFDTLFTTEHSIDQLKQTILQLAVMGKLVPQDPNDEPASVLLEKIAAEKARLVKDKKIKKQKVLQAIGEDEKPFELPEGWEWCRIGNAAISTDYGLSDKSTVGVDGVPVLAMGHIQTGKVILGGQKVVPPTVESLPDLYLENRDLLYNRTNSAELVGKTGIFIGNDNEFTFASYLIRIRADKKTFLPEFINMNMLSPQFRSTQIEPHLKQQCGQANVNGTIMKNMLVALAPKTEMSRITSKVDELLALCETLKARINESQTTQLHLADAMAEQALQ